MTLMTDAEEAEVLDAAAADRFRKLYDTVLATANALAAHPSVGNEHATVRSLKFVGHEHGDDICTPGYFTLRLEVLGIDGEVSIAYHIFASETGEATITKVTTVGPTPWLQAEDLWSMAVSTLTPATLASHLVHAVMGVPTIPPRSRRQAREIEDSARIDAKLLFARGLNRMLSLGESVHLAMLDESEAWDRIVSAGMDDPGRFHMALHRELQVPLVAIDIYDDAWYETAGNLMSILDCLGAPHVRFAGEPEMRWQ